MPVEVGTAHLRAVLDDESGAGGNPARASGWAAANEDNRLDQAFVYSHVRIVGALQKPAGMAVETSIAVHQPMHCRLGDRYPSPMEEPNAVRYRPGEAAGHYESFFLRANHPARPLAFWIR